MRHLDRVAGLLAGALLAAIALTVLAGDRVGVRVTRYGPEVTARPLSTVLLQFSEDMAKETLDGRLEIDPTVPGRVSWTGRTLSFAPVNPLEVGATYRVRLRAGAQSQSGREVREELAFSFRVVGPRIAYLGPVGSHVQDVWLLEPRGGPPIRLTHSETGVLGFDVSPDGSRIAYAEGNSTGPGSDIKVIGVDTGEQRTLTRCGEGTCTSPVWSPDGQALAFERIEAGRSVRVGVPGYGGNVWIVDLSGNSPVARALLTDDEAPPHYHPRWAPDGTRLAVSTLATNTYPDPGILLASLSGQTLGFYKTLHPSVGALSPSGDRLIFPLLVAESGGLYTVLQGVNLMSGAVARFSPPEIRMDTERIAWNPDGSGLVVGRRFLDNAPTRGNQLYWMPAEGGQVQRLVVDSGYDSTAFAWDPTGARLAFLRSNLSAEESAAALWLYDRTRGDAERIAINVGEPHWVP
jgi:Tol biopolymer transport system component